MKELRFAGNCLCMSSAGNAIANMLEATATLTALDLSRNYNQYFASSGSGFARALSPGLATNRTLMKLNVSHNQLGSEGTRLIAEALRGNQAVKEIKLVGNNFAWYSQTSGADALLDSIPTMQALTSLDLAGNHVRTKAAAQLKQVCGARGVELRI